MPSSDSQAFLRKPLRSDDTPVVIKTGVATGVSPLPKFTRSVRAKLTPIRKGCAPTNHFPGSHAEAIEVNREIESFKALRSTLIAHVVAGRIKV